MSVSAALPPGPTAPAPAQTLAFHRDPLGALRRARNTFGPVFTIRLSVAGPMVAVADIGEVPRLLDSDPLHAHAGEARRHVLPMASPRSEFGGDGVRHQAARGHVEPAFTQEALDSRRAEMAAIAERHVASWPTGRPFRVLPRMRALIDDVCVHVVLGVRDERRGRELVAAIGRMLWSPGNPPMPIPGEGNGLPGALATALFKRRHAPVSRLLVEEIEARRRERATESEDIIGSLLRTSDQPADAAADELLALLMAAQEPPAAATTWLLDRLGRTPGLIECFADGNGSDPVRDAIVRETLRVRPAALAALRRLTEPAMVSGHELPAGAVAMVPIPLMHRDPLAFPDPDRFNPGRWASGAADESAFLPFGGGVRRCVGEHLAQLYIHTLVPAILRRIHLQPLRPRPERMVLRATILVPHRSGLMRGSAPRA